MADAPLIFHYGQAVPQCDHRIDKHFEGYCTLQYMSGGAVALSIDGDRRLLEGRWFWSCYPGPRIAFCPAIERSTWNHRYLAFSGDLVRTWEQEQIFPIPPQSPPHGADYSSRFDELLALSRREDKWGVRRAINVLEGILIELAEWRNRTTEDVLVSRAIGLLHDSADDPVQLSQLAGHLGVSERTLRRRFIAATGMSPQRYVIQHRTAAARRLLAETDLPIKQIAEQLGYRDVFFFTRQFKKATGVSPGEYRRTCAG